jgi:hypothetical protein
MDQWEPTRPSAAALLDEQDFLQRCADDLRVNKPPDMSPAPRSDLVTDDALDDVLKRIGEKVGAELRKLRARIADLEAKQLKMGGVWKAGVRYQESSLVTHQGGLFLALCDTDTRPGGGSPAWRLAVKAGAGGAGGDRAGGGAGGDAK